MTNKKNFSKVMMEEQFKRIHTLASVTLEMLQEEVPQDDRITFTLEQTMLICEEVTGDTKPDTEGS